MVGLKKTTHQIYSQSNGKIYGKSVGFWTQDYCQVKEKHDRQKSTDLVLDESCIGVCDLQNKENHDCGAHHFVDGLSQHIHEISLIGYDWVQIDLVDVLCCDKCDHYTEKLPSKVNWNHFQSVLVFLSQVVRQRNGRVDVGTGQAATDADGKEQEYSVQSMQLKLLRVIKTAASKQENKCGQCLKENQLTDRGSAHDRILAVLKVADHTLLQDMTSRMRVIEFREQKRWHSFRGRSVSYTLSADNACDLTHGYFVSY